MATQTSGNLNNAESIGPDEYPFYENEVPEAVSKIPQGPGSGSNSDTVDGLQAVTASKAGPNKLVATGSDGKLPISVILGATLAVYANNAAAVAGGLAVGSFYRTGADPDPVMVVH